MEHCFFWLILFSIVLGYDIYLEKQYILIYYTIQTFLLEIFFFLALCLSKWYPRANYWKQHFFDTVLAPAIVVCLGFWLIIAPTKMNGPKPQNGVLMVVTHGFNVLALWDEMLPIQSETVWKPLLFTFLYNLFLIAYVGAGGRSISGKLPYWYCHYDTATGWVFAVLSIFAVGLLHVVAGRFSPPKSHNVPKRSNVEHLV